MDLKGSLWRCVEMIICCILLRARGVSTCEAGFYECSSDRRCILEEELCDGFSDCLDGEDESKGCRTKYNCTGLHFLCTNRRCLPSILRCDGVDDCEDGLDEKNCGFHHCSLRRNTYLCEFSGRCIEYKKVCDSVLDCEDDSDEGPLCGESMPVPCGCKECLKTPKGPMCVCDVGYEAVNNTFCEDINECSHEELCDQVCINTPGSYRCECDRSEYTLDPDGRTCRPTEGASNVIDEVQLLYATKNKVNVLMNHNLGKFPLPTCHDEVAGEVLLVSFSPIVWTILCISTNNNTLLLDHVAVLPFHHQRVLPRTIMQMPTICGTINSATSDWVSYKFYLMCQNHDVVVCTQKFLNCYTIYSTKSSLRALAVSPPHGLLFTLESSTRSSLMNLNRGKMNGSDFTNILHDTLGSQYPAHTLTVDENAERVFFFNIVVALIESVKFDGTGRKAIVSSVFSPISMAVFENEIFWTKSNSNVIYMHSKNTGKAIERVFTDESQIKTLAPNTDYKKNVEKMFQRMESPCLEKACSDLCLLTTDSEDIVAGSCICEKNGSLSADGLFCEDTTLLATIRVPNIYAGGSELLFFVIGRIWSRNEKITRKIIQYPKPISAMAYNPQEAKVLFYDTDTGSIMTYSLKNREENYDAITNVGNITTMKYDALSNNIFLCSREDNSLKVLSLHTNRRKVIVRGTSNYTLTDFSIDQNTGIIYVSFVDTNNSIYIHRYSISNDFKQEEPTYFTGITSGAENRIVALNKDGTDKIFIYPGSPKLIGIEKGSDDSSPQQKVYVSTGTDYISDMTVMNDVVFYAFKGSSSIRSTNVNGQPIQVDLDLMSSGNQSFTEDTRMLITAISSSNSWGLSPCLTNNGNCEHICIDSISIPKFNRSTSNSKFERMMHVRYCLCEEGYLLANDGLHCHRNYTSVPPQIYISTTSPRTKATVTKLLSPVTRPYQGYRKDNQESSSNPVIFGGLILAAGIILFIIIWRITHCGRPFHSSFHRMRAIFNKSSKEEDNLIMECDEHSTS